MSHQTTSTDVALARGKPLEVIRPAAPRERSKGDQSLGTLLAVYAAILALVVAFAGFLLSITPVGAS
ncbi:hypothetical protein [Micromonospora chokoriensis]|uniref:hypothetical protein n=1 Tax=Micromonospora chokoriensis TaxID=356851 RepID=UPI000A9C6A81|nr:hypothetical protein [Micromonospora chokoriensis]